MKLNDITQYIQEICQNISKVLDVDVTVVSKDLYRIAGTGIFKDKIGDKISEIHILSIKKLKIDAKLVLAENTAKN